MFKTTIRNLMAHRVRLLAAALSVVLGVALMAGTFVLTDTVGAAFDELYASVGVGTDAVVRADHAVEGQGEVQRPPVDAALADQLRSVPGVARIEGTVQGYAQFVGRDGKAIGRPGQGPPTLGLNWPSDPRLNPFTLVDGRAPDAPDQMVIDRASARTGGFALGDTVTVLTKDAPRSMVVVGIVTFGGADSPLGASIALFTTTTAQALVGTPGRFDGFSVVAAPGTDQETLVANLRRVLPPGTEAITGAAATAEQQAASRKGLAFFSTFLLAFALIAMFVGSFIIANSFAITVAQRTRELGLLRALGAGRAQVRRAVLAEAAVLGSVASAVGVGAGIGAALGLEALLNAAGFEVPARGLVLQPRSLVAAGVVGWLVTLASALLPARRAGRLSPVTALRDVDLDSTGGSRRRLVLGGAVTTIGLAVLGRGLVAGGDAAAGAVGLGAAVTFVGVAVLAPLLAPPVGRVIGAPLAAIGITGRLAQANGVRNPRRTAATASALMVGVALVACITVFAASGKASLDRVIDDSFRSDLVIDSGARGFGGLSPALATELARVPEVAEVVRVRLARAEVAGAPTMLVALDPAGASRVADVGVQQGAIEALDAHSIAVSTSAATAKGWHLGDTVPVTFASGRQDLRIVAVYANRNVAGDQFIAIAAQEAYDMRLLDAQLYLRYHPGADPAAARRAVDAATAAYPTASAQDLTGFKAERARPIDQMLALIYALLLLAVLIAVIGIANTTALSVHERTREIGLLRAVGMSRRQLRATVRKEAMIVALFGATLGLAVGVGFGWALVRALASQGITELRLPMAPLAVVVVLAGLSGLVAGAGPARRGARLDILRAVRSD